MSREDNRQQAERAHEEAPEAEIGSDREADSGDAQDAAGSAAVEPEGGEEDIERSAEEEVAQLKEAMLRMRADMDNREKRLDREMARSRKFALESLMRDLVPVLDSIDHALASADTGADSMREGMELTRKQAIDVLGRHGLEVLDPVGERFDPTWHEAMTTRPSEEHEPDTVVEVLQKGYSLHERLLRPARVVVAKAVS